MPLLGDTRGRRQSDRSVKEPERSNAASPISTPAHALGQSPASYFGNLPVDNFSLDTPSSESAASSQPQTNRQLNAAVEALAAQRREEPSRPLAPPSDTPPLRNFVGTPDYLAPESILGVGTDACVDWVSGRLTRNKHLADIVAFRSGLWESSATSEYLHS